MPKRDIKPGKTEIAPRKLVFRQLPEHSIREVNGKIQF